MTLPSGLMELIRQGENTTVEFKKSTTDITKDGLNTNEVKLYVGGYNSRQTATDMIRAAIKKKR